MSLSTQKTRVEPVDVNTDNSISRVETPVPLRTELLYALLVFAAVLALCLWQNPSSVEPRTTLYFDGGHYLDSCKQISGAIREWLTGVATKTTAESVAYYLLLDGPVLPLAGAIAFAVHSKAPNPADWLVLVQMQCVLQAFAAVGIYCLTRILTGRPRAGLTAGLMWGIYPATIASCGLFLTEPLACALAPLAVASLYLWLVRDCRFGFSGIVGKVLTGGVLAALGLLKTALIPALAIVTFLAVLCSVSRKRALVALLVVGFGAVMTITPWIVFTQYATGHATLFPSRKPVYNIATGMNIESDGWGCYPTHPVTAMFSDDEPGLSVAAGLYSAHPSEISNLFLRKIVRFWASPWNDFRYRICGMNFKFQTLLQSLLVWLGLAGAVLFGALAIGRRASRGQQFVVLSSIGIIIAHLIYLPFEGIARYGFTAMPFFIVLAASAVSAMLSRKTLTIFLIWLVSLVVSAGLLQLDLLSYTMALLRDNSRAAMVLEFGLKLAVVVGSICFSTAVVQKCLNSGQERCKSVVSTMSAVLAFFAALILFAFEFGDRELPQWQSPLKPGMSATRAVNLVGAVRPDWVLLLIDGDAEASNAQLTVNGKVVKQPLESLYQYYPRKYELQNYFGMFASLLRQSPEKLRQWRAVQIDPSLLNFDSPENELKITATTGKVTIFGDFVLAGARDLFLPSIEQISPGKLFNSTAESPDCRMMQKVGSSAALAEKCYIWSADQRQNGLDLSTKPGLQQGRFRLFLVAGYGNHSGMLAAAPAVPCDTPVDIPLISTMFDAGAGPARKAGDELELKSSVGPYRAQVLIPASILSSSHVDIEITGTARSTAGAGNLAMAAVLRTGNKQDLASILPGCPALVKVDSAPHAFALRASVPSNTLRGSAPAVVVELSSSVPVVCDKLSLRLRSVRKADFDGHTIKFF